MKNKSIKRPDVAERNKSQKQRDAVSSFMKGKPSSRGMLGKKHTKKTKNKIKVKNKKYKPTEQMKKKLSEYNKLIGRKPPIMAGEKNPRWKGGFTYLQKLEIKAGRRKPDKCELCGRIGRIYFDHSHKTGNFRGWICVRCNTVLGLVGDNIETLELLIKYLETGEVFKP
jgi:hypothetical protein